MKYPEMSVPATSHGSRRPKPPQVIVLHHTAGSGNTANEVEYLRKNDRGVSIHYHIAKDGLKTRMVPDDIIAYHVGNSLTGSLGLPNNVSLGIEISNRGDGKDPYTLAQIESVAETVALWLTLYPIQMVTSHAAIDTKGKIDPLAFPWQQFWGLVADAVRGHNAGTD